MLLTGDSKPNSYSDSRPFDHSGGWLPSKWCLLDTNTCLLIHEAFSLDTLESDPAKAPPTCNTTELRRYIEHQYRL